MTGSDIGGLRQWTRLRLPYSPCKWVCVRVRVSWAAAPESHPLLSVFCSFLRDVTTEGEGHGARDPSVLIPITAGASTTT